jgi:hypothetical protein
MSICIDFNTGFIPRPEGTLGVPLGNMLDFGFPASVNIPIIIHPTLNNDLAQLDKGEIWQGQKINKGPSLGDELEYILTHRYVTANVTMGPLFQVALVQGGQPVTIQLPDVVAWMKRSFDQPFNNVGHCFWIKDYNNQASVNNITVLPFGVQTIDGLSQYVMNSNRALIRIYPRSDLVGWYVG